MTIIFISRN